MTISLHNSTEAVASTTVTSLACNVPTVTNGDLMLMYVTTALQTSSMAITGGGWNLLTRQDTAEMSTACYWRIASSEPASYTVTWTTSSKAIIVMQTWSGVDQADPFVSMFQSKAGDTAGGGTHTVPGVICNAGKFVAVSYVAWNRGNVTVTNPSGYSTDRGPNINDGTPTGIKAQIAYRSFTNAQDGPSISWGTSNSTTCSIIHIGLRDANYPTRMLAMRSFGNSVQALSTTDVSPPLPYLHRTNSLLIAFIGQLGLTSPTMATVPTGWNLLGSIQHQSTSSLAVYYKTDNGSETDPPVWAWSSSATSTWGQIIEIDYAGASPFLGYSQGADTTSNTTYDFPAVTLSAQNPGYLKFAAVHINTGGASNWQGPAGWGQLPAGRQVIPDRAAIAANYGTAANPGLGQFGGGTSRQNAGWQVIIGSKLKLRSSVTFIG